MRAFQKVPLFFVFSARGGRILWFLKKLSRFLTCFLMQIISLVVLRLTDNNTRNFSFTFIICPSIITQNTINTLARRGERVIGKQFGIHRGLLMTLATLFDLEDQNFLTVRVDGQIHSLSLKHTLFPIAYLLRQYNPLWTSNILWHLLRKIVPSYIKTFA